jgi:hypothetical protein
MDGIKANSLILLFFNQLHYLTLASGHPCPGLWSYCNAPIRRGLTGGRQFTTAVANMVKYMQFCSAPSL